MNKFTTSLKLIFCRSFITCVLVLAARLVTTAAAETLLDVNDVSYLWPTPKDANDVSQLISVAEPIAGNASRIWPEPLFQTVLQIAPTVKLTQEVFQIRFQDPGIQNASNWKIVGLRIDPNAAGTHESSTSGFGSRPQIRLIAQPVTTDASGRIVVHDITAHLVFDIILRDTPEQLKHGAPDVERFKKILADIKSIKSDLQASGVSTAGNLSVHPGFKLPQFAEKMKAFLQTHLRAEDLDAVSFMGIRRPEPWIFFALAKGSEGEFKLLNDHPSLKGEKAQMLKFLGGDPVVPFPNNTTFGDRGVSTALLFANSAVGRLDSLLFTDGIRPDLATIKLRDVPDIIANPQISHFFNTDCVSCHSESSRRKELNAISSNTAIQYKRPAGISGLDPTVLPANRWNVRNFGWFPSFDGSVAATATTRTANESAEAADFINRVYLAEVVPPNTAIVQNLPLAPAALPPAEPKGVSNALTLIMKIKSQEDLAQLVALLNPSQDALKNDNEGKLVTPKRIANAMNDIATVHFARFVIVPKEMQLMVITDYDGDFDRYIDAFTDSIGDIFEELLSHVEEAPPFPLKDHREEFLAYVKKNDRSFGQSSYSAYPQLKVQDILTLQRKASE